MRNMYLSAPRPFVGQKRMFAKEFIKVLTDSQTVPFLWIFLADRGCCPTSPNG